MTNRLWLQHYAPGVPANINPDEYPTLVDFLNVCLKKYRNEIAFECMGTKISYEKLDSLSTDFGAYLHMRGLEPGDKIALMMPNLLQYPIALYGSLKAGLVVVNTNPLYTKREMLYQFKDAGVKAVLILENFAHQLESILPQTDIKVVITTSVGERLGLLKGLATDFVIRHFKRMVPKYGIENAVSFNEALELGKKFSITAFDNKPEDVIILQYTGGTTGVSKGAMLTNRNIIANMMQIKAVLGAVLEERKEVALCPLPLYHIFAFTANCLGMMWFGGKNVLVVNPRDISSLLKEFSKNKITLVSGLNTLFNAMMNHSSFKESDFSHLKAVVSGGMALNKDVAERWEDLTGIRITEGYGLTETSPVACVDLMGKSARTGTIGFPVPSTDMKILDDNGNEVPQGVAGEIAIAGPQVMLGYYNKPEETQNVLKDGWLLTGDIGIMDEDGYFRILDRKKDMIIVSGFNVFPNEIEDVLMMHPKVMEAAVIGVEDGKSGEVVKAYIVKKDKSLKEAEILDHCKEFLTGYKIPKHIEFRDSLPKTPIGKILRRELKENNE